VRIWEDAEGAAETIDENTPTKVDGVAELYHDEIRVQIRRPSLFMVGLHTDLCPRCGEGSPVTLQG